MAYLQRTQVITAAIEFIDTNGVHALTMGRLGKSLGAEVQAVYRLVPGRPDLLKAVVEEFVEQFFQSPLMQVPVCSWEGYLHQVAQALRKIALEHPRVFLLFAEQSPEAPWLRPPLGSLRWVN